MSKSNVNCAIMFFELLAVEKLLGFIAGFARKYKINIFKIRK